MIITNQNELEEAALKYGILPFFRNNIKGLSVEEMTPPGLLFGGNEYMGCWEWKGPVIRRRNTAYGKFFRKKAGFISRELLPYFLTMRRQKHKIRSGTVDEMIFDIIEINDNMTSTDLRQIISGKEKRRTAFDLPDLSSDSGIKQDSPLRHKLEGPLSRLQTGGWICISDFRYKQTKSGSRYGWGVAEYSTPEMIYGRENLLSDLTPEECMEHLTKTIQAAFPSASREAVIKLLS